MKIRGLRRYRYKSSDKYRAETFRIVGLAFCTPLGMAISDLLRLKQLEFVLSIRSVTQFMGIVFLFIAGVAIMTCGLNIMVKFDKEEAL